MNKAIFEQYAELKIAEKEIKEKIDALQPEVMAEMGENEEVETDMGKFIIGTRRSWNYPEAIKTAEADIKVAKKTAEQTGDATYTENPYLLFKVNKG